MSYWTPKRDKTENDKWYTPPSYIDKKKKRTKKDDDVSNGNMSLEHLRKRGFQEALRGIQLDKLLEENNKFYNRQNEHFVVIAEQKAAPIIERIDELKEKINETSAHLDDTKSIKENLAKEKTALEKDLIQLEKDFVDLNHQLGEAQKELIKNRFTEVHEELNDLVKLYNEIFENKLGKDEDLKTAVEEHRKTCNSLIKESKETLEDIDGALNAIYKYGTSRESAKFLIFAGLISAMAAGWFFTIFTSSNDIVSQNWLFFSLNNLFNYLALYPSEHTTYFAAGIMIFDFLIILGVITALIFIAEFALYKFSNEQPDLQFDVQVSQKKKGFFKLRIKSNSTLSFWLQILPWAFIVGLITILISVGQYDAQEEDQMRAFSKNLSGQVMGLTFALLYSGLFFIYITKVIEPRKLIKKKNESENELISTTSKRKKKNNNVELLIVVVAVNLFLILLIFSQAFEGFQINKSSVLSLICFMITTNLTAFVLAYGLRQKGLFKTKDILERRILYLNKLVTALSGSKPINIWISEERQFQKNFLKIQRDLFGLIHAKNLSLNYLKRSEHAVPIPSKKQSHVRLAGIKLWKRRTNNFNNRNFPSISSQISTKIEKINNTKGKLEKVTEKIETFQERRSGFETTIHKKLDSLTQSRQDLIKGKASIEIEMLEEIANADRNRVLCEQEFIEGHGLGLWTRQQLNPNYEK